MRRQYIIAALMVAVAMVLAFSLGERRPAQAAGPVLAGYDLLETDSSSTWQDFALPAGFFGPGCAAYTGRINFEGVPFDTYNTKVGAGTPTTPYTGLSPTDTIVQRLAQAGPTFPASIPVKIVKLSLRSINNVVVACPDGTEVWNTKAEVLENDQSQTPGKMTIRHEFADCGTFDVTLPVAPTLTFTRKGSTPGVIGPFVGPTVSFSSTNNIWCDNVSDPLASPPGDMAVKKPGLTTNFFPGAENVPNKGTVKHVTFEEATFAQHGVRFAETGQAAPIGGISLDPRFPGSSGSDAGLLAGAMAALAGAVALGGGVWYARRRRVQ